MIPSINLITIRSVIGKGKKRRFIKTFFVWHNNQCDGLSLSMSRKHLSRNAHFFIRVLFFLLSLSLFQHTITINDIKNTFYMLSHPLVFFLSYPYFIIIAVLLSFSLFYHSFLFFSCKIIFLSFCFRNNFSFVSQFFLRFSFRGNF